MAAAPIHTWRFEMRERGRGHVTPLRGRFRGTQHEFDKFVADQRFLGWSVRFRRQRSSRDAQDPEWVVVDTERGDRVVAYHGTSRTSRYDARDDAAQRNRAANRMRYAYKPEYALEGGGF